ALVYEYGYRDRSKESEQAYQEALAVRQALAKQFPGFPKYTVDLGTAQVNLGNLMRETARPEAALTWYDQAVRTLQPAVSEQAQQSAARQALRDAYWGRAFVQSGLGRAATAVPDWDRAI